MISLAAKDNLPINDNSLLIVFFLVHDLQCLQLPGFVRGGEARNHMHGMTSKMASPRLEQCELTSYETGDLESDNSDCSEKPSCSEEAQNIQCKISIDV